MVTWLLRHNQNFKIDRLPNFLSNGAPLTGFARRLCYNKLLMTGSEGKSLFCFPRISIFMEGNIEIWGKQNKLVPQGTRWKTNHLFIVFLLDKTVFITSCLFLESHTSVRWPISSCAKSTKHRTLLYRKMKEKKLSKTHRVLRQHHATLIRALFTC